MAFRTLRNLITAENSGIGEPMQLKRQWCVVSYCVSSDAYRRNKGTKRAMCEGCNRDYMKHKTSDYMKLTGYHQQEGEANLSPPMKFASTSIAV